MAKKPESQSFMDVFANFGRDLKMPNIDIEKIMDHNRKNLEALEKSAKASAAGASALVDKQREALQDALREFTDLAQSYRISGNPQEMVEKQADFARKASRPQSRMPGKSPKSCANRARTRWKSCANGSGKRWRMCVRFTRTVSRRLPIL